VVVEEVVEEQGEGEEGDVVEEVEVEGGSIV
jgi:hypothetical protein